MSDEKSDEKLFCAARDAVRKAKPSNRKKQLLRSIRSAAHKKSAVAADIGAAACDDDLSASDAREDIAPSALVELAENIVEQVDRLFADLVADYLALAELDAERRRALLTLRRKAPRLAPSYLNSHIVAVDTADGTAELYLALD